MKIPEDIRAALDELGKPYILKTGRHVKIYIEGTMVGTFTGNGKVKGALGHLSIVRRIKSMAQS